MEERVVNFVNDFNDGADMLDYVGELLSRFDLGSSTLASLDPETVLTSTCVVLSVASGVVSDVASFRLPNLTMYQIQASIEKIEGNLKTILTTPLKKAIGNFNFIVTAIRTGNFESGFNKLETLIGNADTAFHYANGQNGKISIESYKECAKAVRLMMFGTFLQESYDQERKAFIAPDKLPRQKINLIGEVLERIARQCIEQKKNVKTKAWGFQIGNVKSESQNVLDSILHFAYPHISRSRQLTDMNKQLRLTQSSNVTTPISLDFSLLPELLPMGKEDKTQIHLGVKTDSDGKTSAMKANVWREERQVYCECEHKTQKESIKSEDREVLIKLPCCFSNPTINIIVPPSKAFLKFSLLPQLLPKGRDNKAQLKLHRAETDDGEKDIQVFVWRKDNTVHCDCEQIKYKTRADIKSESEEVVLELYVILTLRATGEARERWPKFLGDYILTKEQHNGRPVYGKINGLHLFSQEDGTWAASWIVGASYPVMRSTTAAVKPGVCQHWQYMDYDDKYKPGDITVMSNIYESED